MGLREHNRTRLTWFLDKQLPERIQGRIDPEAVMESRRLEGAVLLKKGALDRVDAATLAKTNYATEWDKRYAQSDSVLLYLTDTYLRERYEDSGELRHHLEHSAFRHICLDSNTAGGMVELERCQRLGKNNATIRTVAEFASAAVEAILDELDRRGFRLEVDEDHRRKNMYEEGWEKRKVHTDLYGSYRKLAAMRRDFTCRGMGSKEANQKVAEHVGCSPSKVRDAVKWVRENGVAGTE